MRITVSLDNDVAAAVQRLRSEKNIGLSEAVNELVRAGLTVPAQRAKKFVQRSFPMSARIDVTNVGDTLELLEEPSQR